MKEGLSLRKISYHLPKKVQTNDQLKSKHPDWDVEHYETLIRAAKQQFPDIAIKALTAVEIKHLSQQSDISFKETLQRLKSAGLDSLPGGGAEILNDDVRQVICNG